MLIEPEYSKTQIQRAGEVLIGKYDKISVEDAINILNNWRNSHAYPLNSIQSSVRYRAKQIDDNYIVTQRLKRASSIKNKLYRFPDMKLHRMQDIGGCRVILSDNDLVYHMKSHILETRSINIIREYDYIDNPKETGYRGIHLISQFCGKNTAFKGLTIEIQIRNRLQHHWATAVEIVDRFTKQQLKAGLESNDWVLFFKLMSDLMTNMEKQEEINLDKAKQIQQLDEKLKIREKLNSYSVFVNSTETVEEKEGHFLLNLNTNQNIINVQYFNNDQLIEATQKYAELEKMYEEDNTDIVLVEVESIQELRKGYPNYFADSKSFMELLSSFINKI